MGSFARYVTLESTVPGYAAAELAAPKLNTFKAEHRHGLLESDSAQEARPGRHTNPNLTVITTMDLETESRLLDQSKICDAGRSLGTYKCLGKTKPRFIANTLVVNVSVAFAGHLTRWCEGRPGH